PKVSRSRTSASTACAPTQCARWPRVSGGRGLSWACTTSRPPCPRRSTLGLDRGRKRGVALEGQAALGRADSGHAGGDLLACKKACGGRARALPPHPPRSCEQVLSC